MAANVAMSAADQPFVPHEARGVGKVIRSGPDGGYGHVEVTVTPVAPPSEFSVKWDIVGGIIPECHRMPIIAAIEELLADYMWNHLRFAGVAASSDYGSYHEIDPSLHVEAAQLAVNQALTRGHFFTRML
jgi:hypothetical protein